MEKWTAARKRCEVKGWVFLFLIFLALFCFSLNFFKVREITACLHTDGNELIEKWITGEGGVSSSSSVPV